MKRILNHFRREIRQPQLRIIFVKIRDDPSGDRRLIRGKGGNLHAGTHHFQPVGKKLCEEQRFLLHGQRIGIAAVKLLLQLLSCFQQCLFRFLFVSLFGGNACRAKNALFLSVRVCIAHGDVPDAVPVSQMSCYHL